MVRLKNRVHLKLGNAITALRFWVMGTFIWSSLYFYKYEMQLLFKNRYRCIAQIKINNQEVKT